MNEGTQNIMSLSVAFTAWKRLLGVGMVGMGCGSNALKTRPQDALQKV
jgi:hypothetical protein